MLSNNVSSAVFCSYTGKWLCGKCSGGRTSYQSVSPNNIDGGYYKVCGNALSQIYKAWLSNAVSHQALLQQQACQNQTSHMRQLVVDTWLQLSQLYTLHSACGQCPIYRRWT